MQTGSLQLRSDLRTATGCQYSLWVSNEGWAQYSSHRKYSIIWGLISWEDVSVRWIKVTVQQNKKNAFQVEPSKFLSHCKVISQHDNTAAQRCRFTIMASTHFRNVICYCKRIYCWTLIIHLTFISMPLWDFPFKHHSFSYLSWILKHLPSVYLYCMYFNYNGSLMCAKICNQHCIPSLYTAVFISEQH